MKFLRKERKLIVLLLCVAMLCSSLYVERKIVHAEGENVGTNTGQTFVEMNTSMTKIDSVEITLNEPEAGKQVSDASIDRLSYITEKGVKISLEKAEIAKININWLNEDDKPEMTFEAGKKYYAKFTCTLKEHNTFSDQVSEAVTVNGKKPRNAELEKQDHKKQTLHIATGIYEIQSTTTPTAPPSSPTPTAPAGNTSGGAMSISANVRDTVLPAGTSVRLTAPKGNSYQWYCGSKVIDGATSQTYEFKMTMGQKTYTCRVNGKNSNALSYIGYNEKYILTLGKTVKMKKFASEVFGISRGKIKKVIFNKKVFTQKAKKKNHKSGTFVQKKNSITGMKVCKLAKVWVTVEGTTGKKERVLVKLKVNLPTKKDVSLKLKRADNKHSIVGKFNKLAKKAVEAELEYKGVSGSYKGKWVRYAPLIKRFHNPKKVCKYRNSVSMHRVKQYRFRLRYNTSNGIKKQGWTKWIEINLK